VLLESEQDLGNLCCYINSMLFAKASRRINIQRE